MGNVERYGLLTLFVLCALIVGVGLFGDDGVAASERGGETTEHDRAGSGVREVPGKAAATKDAPRRGLQRVENGESEGSAPRGPRWRDETFPGSGGPEVLNIGPRTETERGVQRGLGERPGKTPAKKRAVAKRGPARTLRHRVKSGDNLWKLSKRYYKSFAYIDLIAKANKMKRSDVLRENRELVIPPVPLER